MLQFDANRSISLCDGLSRRDFLHAGSLAAFGLTLPGWFARRAAGAVRSRSDVNCILLFLVGGPSQHDTWDPKPDAPAEIRGPFKPIATNVTGVRVTDLFPQTAKHADKFTLIRSCNFADTAIHNYGFERMQTGRLASGGAEHPHAGCVVSYLTKPRNEMPTHVLLPRPIKRMNPLELNGQSAGYLGARHAPFILNADPGDAQFKVGDLVPPDYLPAVRMDRRQKMRDAVEHRLLSLEMDPQARQFDDHFHSAYKLMSSPRARKAFDLQAEKDTVRDRYGRTRFGQSCLLARRLIEGGVRFVTVNQFDAEINGVSWDTHGVRPFCDIKEMATLVAPDFDQAYSALLEDMHERGLLENTLVVAMGEFGRTPTINTSSGRDHHNGVYTVALGGGPIAGGRVLGESDDMGYAPKSRPVSPAEVAATIYAALGLDPHHELPGPQNRPMPLVDYDVQPIEELF